MKHSDHNQLNYLMIGAIGIVFGDIGTSPLYALRKCFTSYNIDINQSNVLGIVSLIFWSLFVVVSLKYLTLFFKADNHGEGGILSLTTLCLSNKKPSYYKTIIFLSIIGTALFYGDGVITPAISVLSALEGVLVIAPHFEHFIMPTSIAILALLFLIQKNGSSKIAKYFGPYMLVWFFTIGTIGLLQILKSPQILLAFNPYYGIMFIANYKFSALLTFGAIVLVVTGAEALYADIGHFTKQSVRLAWTIVVFPALMLNYLGQGALLIDNPEAIANPFYLLVPSWAGYPLIILSTFASIIASQSIISGVFSMSWQAIQLGYFPRMKVIHTSSHRIGQVYLPAVNVIMCILTILAVLLFENSDRMAAAYGISVTGMMLITTTLGIILATTHWKWSKWKVALIFSPLLLLDTIFATTNFDKILGGGWFPIMITIAIYYVITTWREGRKALDACIHRVNKLSLIDFIKQEPAKQQTRIPGTAVYMYHPSEQIPTTLEFNLLHNKFLHEKIIFLSIATQEVPKIHLKDRIHIEEIEKDIFIVTVNYGFIEVPNLHTIFERIKEVAHIEDLNQLSFFLAKSVPVPSNTSKLSSWKVKLFIFLARNAIGATEFFKIPYNRVLEMGLRYKI